MATPVSGNSTGVVYTPITPTAGAAVTLTGDSTTVSLNDTYGTQSAAHRANTAATVPGEHTIEATVGFIAGSEAASIYKSSSLRPHPQGATGTLVITWEGAATGGPSESFTALITGRTINSEVNGIIDGEYTFAAQSEITYGSVA